MLPPSAEVSRMDALRAAWVSAGLADVETRAITVARSFADFEDFWASVRIAMSMAQAVRELSPAELEVFKARVQARLPADAAGRITFTSRANAVKGRVPGA
jgi:hypothetical protein